MSDSGGATILIVDDDVDVAEAYASQLRERHEVETAYSGEVALSELSSAVDIVLLDRQMPGQSGGEVLAAIRERDLDIRVAMVTATEPDFDIIEMPFDAYVAKPVSSGDLFQTVTHLQRCLDYEEQLRQYYALTSKRSALVESKTPAELEASDAFQSLEQRHERVRASLDDIVDGFDSTDFERAFRDIDDAGSLSAD